LTASAGPGGPLLFKQEILEVPGLLTTLFITSDGVSDDARELHCNSSSTDFHNRLTRITARWASLERATMEMATRHPAKCCGGHRKSRRIPRLSGQCRRLSQFKCTSL